ncbi:hypothetical protein LX99_02874 [Mucilaginibacter oryzae]|uniref:DUF4397 domain-containing protein n=1 Tax=Mucilaginibacter oryzae TaxID=468058 RepID=A0A316H7V3_9SPHI|nr:DUF4397 domain-containing protein [Mucilaginibacter oryzae]PWK77064.1 hypothetical protein LX99_02874 [Mucilaginibacter oryzae]
MKTTIKSILIACCLLAFSCKKEEAGYGDKTYYGNVSISQVGLTDSEALDVYFNGSKMQTIAADGTLGGFRTKAGQKGKLAVYKANTNTLQMDTDITVPKNGTLSFKVICSQSLGAVGFIDGSPVGPDSVKVQLINSLNTTLYPYPNGVDVCVYTLVGNKIADSVTTVRNVRPGKLDPRVITLRHVDASGKGIFLVAKLKDPATQKFIGNTSNGAEILSFLNTSAGYNGRLNLIQYYDNGGDRSTNRMLVKVTTLVL